MIHCMVHSIDKRYTNFIKYKDNIRHYSSKKTFHALIDMI